jgi:PKD repeat protein
LGNVYTSGTSSPVTVTGGSNQAPSAAFTASCSALACTVDGSASADPDGSISSYAWDFGDGRTGTGATTSHTYAAAGTYTITLTVTDNAGARGAVTHNVTVAPTGTGQAFAADTFDRSVTNGWGSADTGGAWSAVGSSSALSVAPGAGRITLSAAGASAGAYLSTPSASADLTTTLAVSPVPNGGGMYIYVVGRRVATNSEYRGVIKISSTGSVTASFSKLDGSSTEVAFGSKVTVAGVTLSAGTPLHVRMRVSGSGTTSLALTVWTGSTEPASPSVTASDGSAGLQSPGGVGVRSYLSGSATNVPVVLSVSSLRAVSAA